MKQEPVYVRQFYEKDAHLNPVINKVKQNLLKKSNSPSSPKHSRKLTAMEKISEIRKKKISLSNTEDQSKLINFDSPVHSQQLYRNQQPKEENFSVNEFSQIVQSEKCLLMERNKRLQSQLKTKDGKISELGRKYDQLQMRLLAVYNNPFDNNVSSLGQTSRFQKSLKTSSVSDRSSELQQLKSIRERLKNINLSKFFSENAKAN